jgi:zinc D-Ala-D-Ala dipeptidase
LNDLPPIPLIIEPDDWGRLLIVENDEPLLSVPMSGRVRGRSLYAEMGIPDAPAVVTVRAGVLSRLNAVVAALPETVALIVFDGYRPLSVQRHLFEMYTREIAANEPHLTAEEVDRKVRHFVAAPVADPLRPPPHRTGGAVDVYLVDAETGAELPMGTAPDEITEASATRWFEERPGEPFTANRRLLWHAMTDAGFANYPGEWWHFEFGNQRWANITDAPHAVYGLPGEGDIGL